MATTLLMKTRRLNRLLQKAAGQAVNFMEMAEVLKDTIGANVYVISRKGKILGAAITNPLEQSQLQNWVNEAGRIPEECNEKLKQIGETASSNDENSPFFAVISELSEELGQKCLTVVPIIGGGERIGTLLIAREQGAFDDDDLVLAEYGATVVGMEILRERSEEIQEETRNRAIVQVAVGSLSYSETEAVEHIFDELEGKSEGLLVASKIADRVGITRSVIVNALRKLESAGVIETKSLGMKGTYIRILNDMLIEEFEKVRA
jgi:transcriptional pleiotropic repressor